MKRPILAASIAFALASVASVGAAQDETQTTTTTMQNVNVTGTRTPFETYVVDLHRAYGLQVLVGNTHKRYMQAQRAAQASEDLRMRGISMQPHVSVAIDNSTGPGVARQIQLMDAHRNMVAIVNVYCKAFVPSGDSHCRVAPQSLSNTAGSQQVASTLRVTTIGAGG